MKGLKARKAALHLLGSVFDEKQLFEHALSDQSKNTDYLGLDERDRSLARAICLVVFRHKLIIDKAIKRCLERPLAKRQKMAARILQIAAAQIAFLDIPDHASVSVSTELSNSFPETVPLKAMINAVCHRMIREKNMLFARAESGGGPKWLFTSLVETYGEDTAWAINAAHAKEAPIDLIFKDKAPAELSELSTLSLPFGSQRLISATSVPDLPGFSEGLFWVQDIAASLPVKLLGDLSGSSALDLCAAPGGKSMQLIAQGATVTAVDKSEERLTRLKENLSRVSMSAQVVTSDVTTYEPEKKFDIVLLDAPCSATGTIRRNPDLMWSKSPSDFEALVEIQRDLLTKASRWVKSGGTLLYCTCSLLPREGEEQAQWFLDHHPDFVRAPFDAGHDEDVQALITENGEMRSRPDSWDNPQHPSGGLDGFYAVLFRCNGV